jgi:hypothetical protein
VLDGWCRRQSGVSVSVGLAGRSAQRLRHSYDPTRVSDQEGLITHIDTTANAALCAAGEGQAECSGHGVCSTDLASPACMCDAFFYGNSCSSCTPSPTSHPGGLGSELTRRGGGGRIYR